MPNSRDNRTTPIRGDYVNPFSVERTQDRLDMANALKQKIDSPMTYTQSQGAVMRAVGDGKNVELRQAHRARSDMRSMLRKARRQAKRKGDLEGYLRATGIADDIGLDISGLTQAGDIGRGLINQGAERAALSHNQSITRQRSFDAWVNDQELSRSTNNAFSSPPIEEEMDWTNPNITQDTELEWMNRYDPEALQLPVIRDEVYQSNPERVPGMYNYAPQASRYNSILKSRGIA